MSAEHTLGFQPAPASVTSELMGVSNLKRFVVDSVLGYGSFSLVISCRRMSDGRTVALKMFHTGNQSSADRASSWKLKEPQAETPQAAPKVFRFNCLDDRSKARCVAHQVYVDRAAEMVDQVMFVDMLKKMLRLDPAARFTPSQVLEHDFLSMAHICRLQMSSHVWSCYELMKVNHLSATERNQ